MQLLHKKEQIIQMQALTDHFACDMACYPAGNNQRNQKMATVAIKGWRWSAKVLS